ncbi:MAG: hypothetical protein GX576_02685 [Thauera phenolivorans]|uniref:Cyd operon protein YbgE n=1 Tax=Thauera phenolivorans TaxID=1792543 RepID=A0A7X7LTV8_9RHOO|nr:cyd operon YbgE family protein [Thauera phenolivorans]NLF53312.1 hypothetical protein [Thauera phenolivorans]
MSAPEVPLVPSRTQPSGRIRPLPLLLAVAIMLGITAWPAALATPAGGADHWAAMALFWSMSAGFVAGVGFEPRWLGWRLLFSRPACWVGLALAVAHMQWLG